jgi:uncharacterized membrane protein YwzB
LVLNFVKKKNNPKQFILKNKTQEMKKLLILVTILISFGSANAQTSLFNEEGNVINYMDGKKFLQF